MDLPNLIQHLYGQFSFTGLYSFEFVDKRRHTIEEVFLLLPPKGKNVSEPTRASTVPTLGGNYIIDGGNATKTITLTGELFFPYVGSPDNPVSRDSTGLQNTLNGMEEFFKLRWMLIRYRDYTMTDNGRLTVPDNIQAVSTEINNIYRRMSKKVKSKEGVLYDEVQLIFHDYDMDDHYFCRVDSFASNQVESKHLGVEYTITLECHKPDLKKRNTAPEIKTETTQEINYINTQLSEIDLSTVFDNIQNEVGYNVDIVTYYSNLTSCLAAIDTENDSIQAGQAVPSINLPIYVTNAIENTEKALDNFLDVFLSPEQRTSYLNSDVTIDDILSIDLLNYYNSLQQMDIILTSMDGVLKSIVKVDTIRYSASADDYTLTEEQFESGSNYMVENEVSFIYYTVLQGDTSRIIALRELGNQNDFVKILQLNDITENDFIDGTLIGTKIKIPMNLSVLSRGSDNLVYETDYNDSEKFLFGIDLATGLNNELLLSATGDLLGLIGIENVYNNIESRLENTKGSLNVFNPDWGTVQIGDGSAPFLVQVQRYLADVTNQIQTDPRVESVKMNLNKLRWKGEVLEIPTTVYFIGTEETREVLI